MANDEPETVDEPEPGPVDPVPDPPAAATPGDAPADPAPKPRSEKQRAQHASLIARRRELAAERAAVKELVKTHGLAHIQAKLAAKPPEPKSTPPPVAAAPEVAKDALSAAPELPDSDSGDKAKTRTSKRRNRHVAFKFENSSDASGSDDSEDGRQIIVIKRGGRSRRNRDRYDDRWMDKAPKPEPEPMPEPLPVQSTADMWSGMVQNHMPMNQYIAPQHLRLRWG